MYVCTYVRMYVCTYVRTYVRMYVCMYVCMYVRMYICMYVCTYVHMYVHTYVRMYMCIYMHTYAYLFLSITDGKAFRVYKERFSEDDVEVSFLYLLSMLVALWNKVDLSELKKVCWRDGRLSNELKMV